MKPIKIEMIMESNVKDVAETTIGSLEDINKAVANSNKKANINIKSQNLDQLIKNCELAIKKFKGLANSERSVVEYAMSLANLKLQKVVIDRKSYNNDYEWADVYFKQYAEYKAKEAKWRKFPRLNQINWAEANQGDLDAIRKMNDSKELSLLDNGLFKALAKIEEQFESQIEKINKLRAEYTHNSFGVLNKDETNEFIRAQKLANEEREKAIEEAFDKYVLGQEAKLKAFLQSLKDYEDKKIEIIEDADAKIASLKGLSIKGNKFEIDGEIAELREKTRNQISVIDDEIRKIFNNEYLKQIFGNSSNISIRSIEELLTLAQSFRKDKGHIPFSPDQLENFSQLNEQREYYNKLYAISDQAGRESCRRALDELDRVEAGWRRREAQLKQPVEIGAAGSINELSAAIAVCEERINSASAEEAAAWARTKRAYEEKREAMQRGIDAALFNAEAESINDINNNIAILTDRLNAVTSRDEAGLLNREIAGWKRKAEAMSKAGGAAEAYSATMEQAGKIMSSIGSITGGASKEWLNYGANVMATLGTVIPEMIKLLGVDQSISMAEAIKSGAGVPFPGNIFAIAAGVTAVMSAFAGIPKFAKGGIAYGPTLGIFGEYAGASTNPEVVAPLSELQRLIGAGAGGATEGGAPERVELVVDGFKMKALIDKVNNLSRRR